VLVAGRRFGKTYLALTELIQAACVPGRKVWYIAPTNKQGKQLAWKALKQMTKGLWAAKPNETDLTIELIGGGTISVRGADNYDALRGEGLDFIVVDEIADMAPHVWPEVLRPMLSDREGGALFIGTPRGRNHFFDLYEAAQNQPNWAAFQFTTAQGCNVSRQELETASQEMDKRTFLQEFEASFLSMGAGRAYYAFDRTHNIGPVRYNPQFPLLWALDFNMHPFCSVLAQADARQVHVFDEMVLPNSNTLAACEEFLSRTEELEGRPLNVFVYGDATGEQHKTSASRTDWQNREEFLWPLPGPLPG
jgi:Terminase large subunit, T4likevirus-type, N-terminal